MKPSRSLLSVAALLLILAALFITLIRPNPKFVTYQGRPIEFWFAQLPVTPVPPPGIDFGNVRGFIKSTGQQYGGTNLSDESAIDAIKAMGTNSLPFLLAKLQGLDSRVEKDLTKAVTNTGLGYLPFRNADLERLQAVTGLIHAKSLTPAAKHSLGSLRTNSNPDIASAAAYILKRRAALGESLSGNPFKNAGSAALPSALP